MQKPIICAPAIGLFLLTVSAFQSSAQIGTALSFDGTNDFVRPSTNAFTNVSNNFTIEAWVRPAAARNATPEATNGVDGVAAQRYAVFPDQGDFTYGAGHAGAGISMGTNGISVFEHAANYLASPLVYAFATTGWTHVAVVYLNQQPSLYVNGVLARTGLASPKTVHPSAGLGESGQGYGYFSGQLDEFRVWNVARAAGEIRSNMFSVLSGAEPGLVVNYHFNEGTGLTTADSAALNGNTTGNLSNGVAWVTSTAPAGGLSVTMADSLLIDTNGNGKASAGDTIRYTITIQNSGTNTLTNVALNVPVTPNNTLVAGSVKLPPRAVADGPATNSSPGQPFHGPFNVALNIAAPGLLANDTTGGTGGIASFGGGSFPGTATNTAAGSSANAPVIGTLTVNANGSVVFTPAATFNGLATFQYRLTNAIGASIATATLAIGVRPSATGETYLVTGNVRVNTANIPQSVLANDVGDGLVISANTTPANGTVAFAAGGHFVYTPNRGFTGPDSFNYTIMNGFGAANATVALNVSNRVWSVDVLAVDGGDGRAHTPYNSLQGFNAVNNNVAPNPRTNDVIVVRDGSYFGGLVLTNDQRVVGDGWSGTFAAAAGFALAPGSEFSALSGTDPVFSPASGNGVNLALNNQLRGLTVSNSVAGFGFAGGAVGNLVVAECSKRGTGGALSVTTSGAFGSNVNFDVLESTSSPGAHLNLVGVTGTLAANSWGAGFAGSAANFNAVNISGGNVGFTYPAGVTKSTTGALLNVAGGHTGTLTFQTGTLNASSGTGLQFDNADGTYNFNGTTTLNGGDAGVDILNGSSGTFTFGTGTTITHNVILAAFTINLSNCEVTYSGSITDNSGWAVDINNHDSGTVTFQTGSISSSGAAAQGIRVINSNGGTVNFNGQVTLSTEGSNAIDMSTGNGGGTVNFNAAGNGLDITTTSGTGILATGGGTITVTGSGNTINSGTGNALNVVNTTIGASGLTFVSISSSGGANGIVLNNTGTTAGTHGGLTVTGTGATDGSGGTIQNTTGRGASFISARNITLRNMNFTSAGTTDLDADNSGLSTGDNLICNAAIHLQSVTNATLDNLNITGGAEQGINGNNVANFIFNNSSIIDAGNGPDEDGIHFYNMSGTSVISNTTIRCTVATPNTTGGDDHMNLQMQSGTLNLTISGGVATNANKGSGYLFGIRGTANASITFTNAASRNNFSGGLVADVFDTATMNLTVNGSTSSGNNDQLSVSAGDNSRVELDVNGNTLASIATADFVVVSLLGSAFDNGFIFGARIRNNNIIVANGLTADGIIVFNAGGGAMNLAITGNTFDYAGTQRAIALQAGQDGPGSINATVTGNNIDIKLDGTGNAVTGIFAQAAVASPSGDGASLCVDIGGAGALANTFTHSLGGTLVAGDIRVRQRFNSTVRLPGYAGGATDTAAVIAYLNGRNTEVSPSTATVETTGFTGGAACIQP